MNDDAHIPEEDRDRRLARRIADGLEGGSAEATEPSEHDETFFEALLALKRRDAADRAEPSEEQSGRVWAAVEEATRPNVEPIPSEGADEETFRPGGTQPARRRTDRPAHRRGKLHRTPAWIWLSAAAAILLVGIVALLTLRGPDAALVAEAGAERFDYTTTDGSVVSLRPHSRLYRLDAAESHVRYRIEGEAFFDVAERSEGTFAVEAGGTLVEVLGTRFNLSTWGDGPSVFLEEGRIRFTHLATGDAVTLDPGQASRSLDGGVLVPVEDDADAYLDWMSDTVAFDQQPARLVAAELEQHFAVEIGIPEAVGQETLSGRILLNDLASSLDDLGQVMGGSFVQTGPDSYRFVPE